MTALPADWIVPQWDGPAAVRAFFTTRNGDGAAAMDVGRAQPTSDDLAGALGRNRRLLRAHLPADPVWLSQVHGCDVVTVTPANVDALRAAPPQADAAITRERGVVLTVRTADCLPVLLADRMGSVLGVAHAGWRGLAAGVVEATLTAMDVAPHTLVAWLGPAIGPTAFEVGADVYHAYCDRDAGAAAHFAPHRDGKWHADLPALARRRLARLGVTVAGGLWCTYTDPARFHSWRREHGIGRMALVAWLAP